MEKVWKNKYGNYRTKIGFYSKMSNFQMRIQKRSDNFKSKKLMGTIWGNKKLATEHYFSGVFKVVHTYTPNVGITL